MSDVVAAGPRQTAGAYQTRDGSRPDVPVLAMPVAAHANLFISDFHNDTQQISILTYQNGGARDSRGRAEAFRY